MTSQSPRIYTYKITFEEVPYYYYGVHKERRFNEEYWGSPTTHKWAWDFYTPKKQILEIFDYSDEGWMKAQKVEEQLIKPFYNTDKWCLNARCGGIMSLSVCRKNGKKMGQKHKENNTGVCGLTFEQKSAIGKIGGKIGGNKNKVNKTGFCGRSKEKMKADGIKNGTIGGHKTYKLGLGVHGLTKEQRSENGSKGGKKSHEAKVGVHSLTKDQLSENGKRGGKIGGKIGGPKGGKTTSSQLWKCTITGHKTTPGALSRYQKARGIDTPNRIRIL